MRKERPPQGIYAQSPELRRRIDQMLDADATYAVIQREIKASFGVSLTFRALCTYFQKRQKAKETDAPETPSPGAALLTITITGPVKIAIVCDGGAEVQQS
jgi:hypothetical protein